MHVVVRSGILRVTAACISIIAIPVVQLSSQNLMVFLQYSPGPGFSTIRVKNDSIFIDLAGSGYGIIYELVKNLCLALAISVGKTYSNHYM